MPECIDQRYRHAQECLKVHACQDSCMRWKPHHAALLELQASLVRRLHSMLLLQYSLMPGIECSSKLLVGQACCHLPHGLLGPLHLQCVV